MKPTAVDDFVSFYESDTIQGNLLSNDGAGSNGQKFLRFFDGEGVGAKRAGQVTDVEGEHGTFHVKADGSYTYTLSDDSKLKLFAGKSFVEEVKYKISDGAGNTDIATLHLNIKGDELKPNQILLTFDDIDPSLVGKSEFDYKGFHFSGGILVKDGDGYKLALNPDVGGTKLGGMHIVEMDFHDGDGLSTVLLTADGVAIGNVPDDYSEPYVGHLIIDRPVNTLEIGANFAGTPYGYIDNIIVQIAPDVA